MENGILSQGGVLPSSQQCPEKASKLLAMQFQGAERTIVRLVPEKLKQAETIALKTFDIELETEQTVGSIYQRAIGFPAWPIIQDPANAQHALNLVGDLEWARRNARNQAKKVKDRFDALTTTLSASAPHFVPTFLEELARIFYQVENFQYAKQYFGKARMIERAYDLPIDNERHRSTLLEFAVSGVISARELTAEANAAPSRFETPQEAFDFILEINIDRIRAGVAPYAFLVRDLRKLGKLAGYKSEQVDTILLEKLLPLDGTFSAPGGFWKALDKSLITYLRENRHAREILRKTKPNEIEANKYFEILHNAGAIAEIREMLGEHAAWTLETINRLSHDLAYIEKEIRAEVAYAGDRIRGGYITAQTRYIPLNLLDELFEYGAVVDAAQVDEYSWAARPQWGLWTREQFKENRRGLTFLYQHEELRQQLIRELSSEDIVANFDLLTEFEGTRSILNDKFDALLELKKDALGNHEEIEKYLNLVKPLAKPEILEFAPEKISAIFDFDAVSHFQKIIQRGSFVEYTWPAFEKAVERLQTKAKTASYTILGSYPMVIIACGDYIEVVDGDDIVFQGELPAGWEVISRAMFVDGEVVIGFRTRNDWNQKEHWIGSSITDTVNYYYGADGEYTLPLSGGRLGAGGIVTTSDKNVFESSGYVFTTKQDGSSAYIKGRYSYSNLKRWDGQSVQLCEYTAKKILEDLDLANVIEGLDIDLTNATISWQDATIIPMQPTTALSPFGSINGSHVSIPFQLGEKRYQLISGLGTFESSMALAVLQRPGGGVWFGSDDSIFDPESMAEINAPHDLSGTKLAIARLPRECWHQLVPRDVSASLAMRNYSDQDAREVIRIVYASLLEEYSEDLLVGSVFRELSLAMKELSLALLHLGASTRVEDSVVKSIKKALQRHLNTDNEVLIEAITSSAMRVRWQISKFASFGELIRQQQRRDKQAKISKKNQTVPVLTPGAYKVLETLVGKHYRSSPDAVANLISELARFSENQETNVIVDNLENLLCLNIASNERYILGRIGAPYIARLLGKEAVLEFIQWLRAGVAAGVFASGWRIGKVDIPKNSENKNVLPVGSVVEGCLVIDTSYNWIASQRVEQRILWIPDARESVDGMQIKENQCDALKATPLLEALQAIEDNLDSRELSEDAVEALALSTPLTRSAVRYIFGGKLNQDDWDTNFLSKEQRAVLGFSILQTKSVHTQSQAFQEIIEKSLVCAVPKDDPASYITNGLDISAVLKVWESEYGEADIQLTDEEIVYLHSKIGEAQNRVLNVSLPASSLTYSKIGDGYGDYKFLAALIWLAFHRPLNDPYRPKIAQKLMWLKETAQQEYAKNSKLQKAFAKVQLGVEYETALQPYIEQQGVRLLLEGHLDALIEDLQKVYSTNKHAWDPVVSAPEIVEKVMEKLQISEDAARYYLQLLALVDVDDKNIRLWNGWRKKNIDAAAAELVEHELIIEADRPGAGRKRFIPGGWLPGVAGSRPMEVWKTPHYYLWADSGVRPIIVGNPVTVPLGQLYAEVWQRYESGDTPGYKALTTNRYRTRRR